LRQFGTENASTARQIIVTKTVGVEKRLRFHDATGTLRDMVPNCLFQLFAMLATAPPSGFDAGTMQARKTDVGRAVRVSLPDHAVRGQCAASRLEGRDLARYPAEPGTDLANRTATYAALLSHVDNWRWASVWFYPRTGKQMAQRIAEVAIRFKKALYASSKDATVDGLLPNWLVPHIQPDKGISLSFAVKQPGPAVELASARMSFRYADWFMVDANVGYKALMHHYMIGDRTLFQPSNTVETGWRILAGVLDAWGSGTGAPIDHATGVEGPPDADELIERDGPRRCWRPVAVNEGGGP